MRCIYFAIEDGVKKYKTDSFWSTSKEVSHSKLHNTSDEKRFLESYLYNFKYWAEKKDTFLKFKDKYIGTIFGYQTFDESQMFGSYNLVENPIFVEIKNLYTITGIDNNGICEVESYKIADREIKINNIINDSN